MFTPVIEPVDPPQLLGAMVGEPEIVGTGFTVTVETAEAEQLFPFVPVTV